MDISSVLLKLLAGAFVLLVICAIYFFIYKHHINKVLVEPQKKHIRMIPPYMIFVALIIVVAVLGTSFIITILPSLDRISTVSDIEKNVRSFQGISNDWNIEVAMNDQVAGVIAYDDQRSEHIFSIYKSNGTANTNYVFRYGGKSTSIERSVRVFKFEGTTVLISMNALHIAAIECHDGERYEIAPNMPFVLVIPSGGFDVYDNSGKLIDLTQDWWYELTEIK